MRISELAPPSGGCGRDRAVTTDDFLQMMARPRPVPPAPVLVALLWMNLSKMCASPRPTPYSSRMTSARASRRPRSRQSRPMVIVLPVGKT